MMTEEAFLKAMLAAPLDSSPRLIYADWLDEQGRQDEAAFWRQHSPVEVAQFFHGGAAEALRSRAASFEVVLATMIRFSRAINEALKGNEPV
jgi:uncharacterized protein (TIGR02996 family)